ncbi:hypothetical protein SADUNF_Sadunf16G0258800 [Salix dunnii]|uniref:Uncharacterized protein n=1 Tax=Salix dunnii TaxID=1413687 RepID=A0A835MHJ2_9ROSI|nr:hypothetical protein SADUNF_Sadunf16G0258800 [Salix dunnii]
MRNCRRHSCQRMLVHSEHFADLIIEKLKKTDANVSSELQPIPKLDQSLMDLYKGVGEYLSKYTAGKIPKAFKHIPSMQLWEDVLYLTEPRNGHQMQFIKPKESSLLIWVQRRQSDL